MKTVAFTSVTLNYVPKARLLADSYKRHHPDSEFCLLLAEDIPEGLFGSDEPFDRIVSFKELAIPDFERWVFKHSVVEICTAIKAFFLKSQLEDPICDRVLYLDPDIAVFSSLDTVFSALEQHSIVITPHLLEAEVSLDAVIANEICALKHGVYNLGFLAVRNSEEGRRFAQWWQDRLTHFCYADIPGGIFTDQRWIDLVPAFFPDVCILRDEGCNVAPWNISRRKVEGSIESGLSVNGVPLRFYHFSGFDSGGQLVMLKKFAEDSSVLFDLYHWYIEQCAKRGQEQFGPMSWSYDRFNNGEKITSEQRKLYRLREDLQQAFPMPFDTRDASCSYYHWWQAEHATGTPSMRTPHEIQTELEGIYASRSWKIVSLLKRVKRLIS